MSKLTADILNKYGVTYWDPCLEKCIGGKCGDPNTVGCCPVIRTTPLSFVPEASGNSIRSEFVTGSDGNIYYIDKAGVSVLLNKRTIMDNLIAGHPIGRYTNERGEVFIINETVTYIGEMTLDGTILHIPYVNEAGITEDNQVNLQTLVVPPPAQTPITPIDSSSIDITTSGPNNHFIKADIILDQITGGGNNAASITLNGLYVDPLTGGGGGGSYTANNGLTTSSYVHQLGGNLLHDTTIDGLNVHYVHIDDPYNFKIENNISTANLTKFSVDSADGENNIWSLTDVTNQIQDYVHLNSIYNTKIGSKNLTSQDISEAIFSQGTQAQLYVANGSYSSWFTAVASKVSITSQPGGIDLMSPLGKTIGISPTKHFQKNMNTGYSGWVLNTQGNTGNAENNITRSLSGASLGTISSFTNGCTNTQEAGLVIHNNSVPVTNVLPDATLMNNKILEIRAFGTATVTLSPSVKLNISGAMLSTLQPLGSNTYNNPTYVKLLSNGIEWIVITQW